ncbi:helix-turn-helix domain-containing protein [Caulobacter segnis]|uniref:helix-turn-helix domain-containing protein n=1 Tax=Caulobacter segnis TaxID=88688 RepID=UPI002860A9E2|nr:helix-turn-helix domain-containing protein [Caulobacter segnis]MDR6625013.1 hypothetical protein [Caulobacter segnis]
MSLEARNWARRIGGLSIAAKAVLMALADHADSEGKAWPKLKTLAEITSMTERHVRRQIGVLEETRVRRKALALHLSSERASPEQEIKARAALHISKLDIVAGVHQALCQVEFQVQGGEACLSFERVSKPALQHLLSSRRDLCVHCRRCGCEIQRCKDEPVGKFRQ